MSDKTTTKLILSTTGLVDKVYIDDLDFLEMDHPSSVNLAKIFIPGILSTSQNLQEAINLGYVTLVDTENNNILRVEDIIESIFSKTEVSTPGALIRYYSDNGKTVEQSNLVSDLSGLNLLSGNYRIGGERLNLSHLDKIVLTGLQDNDILKYQSATDSWVNVKQKLCFQWEASISSNSLGGTVLFNTNPKVTPFDCLIKAVTLSGTNLSEPYYLDILLNGSTLVSYQRLGTSKNTSLTNLSILLPALSNISFQFRNIVAKVKNPYINIYLTEL